MVADARIAERGDVVAIRVRRAIVEQRDLDVVEGLCAQAVEQAARLIELVIAGDVDRDERLRQLPVSHSCGITKSPSLTFEMPWPVPNGSHRPMVKRTAFCQKSQRSLFQTPTVKLNA